MNSFLVEKSYVQIFCAYILCLKFIFLSKGNWAKSWSSNDGKIDYWGGKVFPSSLLDKRFPPIIKLITTVEKSISSLVYKL